MLPITAEGCPFQVTIRDGMRRNAEMKTFADLAGFDALPESVAHGRLRPLAWVTRRGTQLPHVDRDSSMDMGSGTGEAHRIARAWMALPGTRERVSSGRALFLRPRNAASRARAAALHRLPADRPSADFSEHPLKAFGGIPYPAPSAMRAGRAPGLALVASDC